MLSFLLGGFSVLFLWQCIVHETLCYYVIYPLFLFMFTSLYRGSVPCIFISSLVYFSPNMMVFEVYFDHIIYLFRSLNRTTWPRSWRYSHNNLQPFFPLLVHIKMDRLLMPGKWLRWFTWLMCLFYISLLIAVLCADCIIATSVFKFKMEIWNSAMLLLPMGISFITKLAVFQICTFSNSFFHFAFDSGWIGFDLC